MSVATCTPARDFYYDNPDSKIELQLPVHAGTPGILVCDWITT